MSEVDVARTDWVAYFAALSTLGAGARTTVQVVSAPSPGAERCPTPWLLRECRYDDGGDLLELTLLGAGGESPELRCFVSGPRQIRALESQLERRILVRDAAGVLTLLRLRRRAAPSHLTRGRSSWRTDTPAASRIRLTNQPHRWGAASWS